MSWGRIDYATDIQDIEPVNIILMAESLGTGVAIDYVANYDWYAPIILISPYKSILEY